MPVNDWLIPLLLPGSRRALLGALGLYVALIGGLLSGCAVPIAPYHAEPRFYGSGRSLADGVPTFIVVGKTTRDEVLRELGPAEVEAVDRSWLYYESDFVKTEAGVYVLGAVPFGANLFKSVTYTSLLRRLLVRFSEDSLVSSADFRSQECEASEFEPDYDRVRTAQELKSCEIVTQGLEMRRQRENERFAAAIPAADGPAERFDNALWKDGAAQLSDYEHHGTGALNCRSIDVSEKNRGILAISSRALIFLPKVSVTSGAPPDPIRVPLADIAATKEIRSWMENTISVDVRRHDGSYVSFTVCGRVTSSVYSVRTARAMLEKWLSRSPD
jgi:hypothetical protein